MRAEAAAAAARGVGDEAAAARVGGGSGMESLGSSASCALLASRTLADVSLASGDFSLAFARAGDAFHDAADATDGTGNGNSRNGGNGGRRSVHKILRR